MTNWYLLKIKNNQTNDIIFSGYFCTDSNNIVTDFYQNYKEFPNKLNSPESIDFSKNQVIPVGEQQISNSNQNVKPNDNVYVYPTTINNSPNGFTTFGLAITTNNLNVNFNPVTKDVQSIQFYCSTTIQKTKILYNYFILFYYYEKDELICASDNNNLFSYTVTPKTKPIIPISNTCFVAGTFVTTDQGNICIEKINPEIHTIDNKKILGITQTITQDKHLVCIEKDAFGKNIPSQKIILSKNHRIFYQKKMIPSIDCVELCENVYKVKYRGEILYNVLLEEYGKILVNNVVCETLHPQNTIAKLFVFLQNLSIEKQYTIVYEFNELVKKHNIFSPKREKSK